MMARRIKTLYEQGFLKDVSISEDYYDKVALPAQNIHYLFVKYNLTRDASVRSRIIYQMKNINMIEKEIINKVLENLVVI